MVLLPEGRRTPWLGRPTATPGFGRACPHRVGRRLGAHGGRSGRTAGGRCDLRGVEGSVGRRRSAPTHRTVARVVGRVVGRKRIECPLGALPCGDSCVAVSALDVRQLLRDLAVAHPEDVDAADVTGGDVEIGPSRSVASSLRIVGPQARSTAQVERRVRSWSSTLGEMSRFGRQRSADQLEAARLSRSASRRGRRRGQPRCLRVSERPIWRAAHERWHASDVLGAARRVHRDFPAGRHSPREGEAAALENRTGDGLGAWPPPQEVRSWSSGTSTTP
jgi:hypothetical protein